MSIDTEVTLSVCLGASLFLFVMWRWLDGCKCKRCNREVASSALYDGMCLMCRARMPDSVYPDLT